MTSPSEDATAGVEAPASLPLRFDRALIVTGSVITFGALAPLLDTTVVAVSLPALAEQFSASEATLHWAVTGYLLAFAIAAPFARWGLARWGSKTLWLSALAGFLLSSVLCGLAPSLLTLTLCRLLQGFAGGLIFPVMQVMLAEAAGPRRFARALSTFAIPVQLIPILAPILGGWIVESAGWRWIFLLNLPVCLLAISAAWLWLPAGRKEPAFKMDILGLALLSSAIGLIIYGLSSLSQSSTGLDAATAAASLVAGGALGILCGLRARRSGSVIDLRLFRNRGFAASTLLIFLSQAAFVGSMFLLPLYLLEVHGLSAMNTGLILGPQGLGSLLALPLVGALTDRYGARTVGVFGIFASLAGTLPFALVAVDLGGNVMAAALFLRGIGIVAAGIPVTAAIYIGLDRSAIPAATVTFNIIQRLGAAFGPAAAAIALHVQLGASTASDPQQAFGHTFWLLAATTAAMLLPVGLLPRIPRGASSHAV